MIKQHPSFDKVPDDTVLWQYMPLSKFLVLIKNQKLHLHRINDFPDKNEGVLSVLDKKSITFYQDTDNWNGYLEDDRNRVFISCWIQCPLEQSLMWYAYGKDGVAIRTSAGAIRRAMEIDKEHELHIIAVKYLDKEKQAAHNPGDRINWFNFYVTKRKFFEMEKEVRLVYYDNNKVHMSEKGFDVDIKTDELIEEILVSSSLPQYVYDLICQEVKDAEIKVVPMMSEL